MTVVAYHSAPIVHVEGVLPKVYKKETEVYDGEWLHWPSFCLAVCFATPAFCCDARQNDQQHGTGRQTWSDGWSRHGTCKESVVAHSLHAVFSEKDVAMLRGSGYIITVGVVYRLRRLWLWVKFLNP